MFVYVCRFVIRFMKSLQRFSDDNHGAAKKLKVRKWVDNDFCRRLWKTKSWWPRIAFWHHLRGLTNDLMVSGCFRLQGPLDLLKDACFLPGFVKISVEESSRKETCLRIA